MPHASAIPIRELTERSPLPKAFRDFVEGMVRFNNYLDTDQGEELKAASTAFASAADRDPSFSLARFHQAIAYAHQRREDEAINVFVELIGQRPPLLPELYYNLAQARLHTYRYDQVLLAEEDFRKAEELFGKNPEKRHFRYLARAAAILVYAILGGRRLGHGEDFGERIRNYLPLGVRKGESLLAEYSRHPRGNNQFDQDVLSEAHNGLGAVYMRVGQTAELLGANTLEAWSKSEAHYQACLDIRPTSTFTLQNFGTLHRLKAARCLASEQFEEARSEFSLAREFYVKSLTINPYDQFPYYSAATASGHLEDWESAEKYVRNGKKKHGKVSPELWSQLEKAISQRDPSILPAENV